MKKYIYILALSITGFMASCDDILDPNSKSSLEARDIYSSEELTEGAITSILLSFAETNSYRGRFLPYYGINTDIEILNNSDGTGDKPDLVGYAATPMNTEMNTDNNAWAKMYEGIERANLAIAGLKEYGNVENNPTMAQYLGEALTLRAVYYSDLVKAWGDVPARFEPLTSETSYIPKSDRDVIYKQLLADLDEAAKLVPWPNETAKTSTVERINKAFVKGLRARVALYAGGSSQRPDGTIRPSNDPELSQSNMYAIVKQECLDIINSKTVTLGGFEETFRRLNQEDLSAGNESLWEIPFSEGRGRVTYTFGVEHKTTDKYTNQNKGGTNGPMPHLWYEYDNDDIRRGVTCVPYEWNLGVQQIRKLNSWCFGKWRYEWMSRVVTSDNDDGINWLYMRYADVLLMLAEVLNEMEGPDAGAPYLRMVRERAFPNNPEKVDAFMAEATASSTAFFNAIVDERALEFAGEMLRKADLIRWNLLTTKMDEAKVKMDQLRKREGKYADLPVKVYYTVMEDGETLDIYGLNYGETDEVGATLNYDSDDWITESKISDTKINTIYRNNPDDYQYWPIWQVYIDNSNGTLKNDYNY